MNRSLIVVAAIAAALALSSCAKDPQAYAASSNSNVPVAKLTEIDGCTIYRFHDAGNYRYFAKCDTASTTHIEARVSCGKNCTRADEMVAVNAPPAY